MERIAENESMATRSRKMFRSYFTKKLERKLEEKGLDAPQHLLNLMDVPFEEFTPEDRELYETEFKPLAFVFADHLTEVYRSMGSPRQGWEEMLERLKDSPAKVVAKLVIHEEEKVQTIEDPFDPEEEPSPAPAAKSKINVRTYRNREQERSKERWWGKKLF